MDKHIPHTIDDVPWRKSIATRLTWVTIVVVVAALIVVGGGLTWIARQAQQESAYRLQQRSADKAALLISGYVMHAMENLQLLVNLKPLNTLPRDEQSEALERLLVNHPAFLSQITLLDKHGRELVKISRFHTYLPQELSTQADSKAFQTARTMKTYLSPVYVSPESGLLSIQIAIPSAVGQDAGVLTAEVNITQLWEEVARIDIGQTGYAYLVDNQGRFAAYQEPAKVLQRYGEDMRRMPPVAAYLNGKPYDRRHMQAYRGLIDEPVIGLYEPIAGTPWAVVVELPMREAYASVNQMLWYLLGLTAMGVIIAGGLVFLFSRRMVSPIRDLTLAARRIGQGELDVTISEVRREDEVGFLADVFRRMQEELKTLYRNMEAQLIVLKNAQVALQQSEEQYRTIVESTGEGVWVLDTDGRTLFVNAQMADMLGYSVEEMLGRAMIDFLDQDSAVQFKVKLEHRRQGQPDQYDLRLRRKDMSFIWGIINARPVFGRDGTLAGSLVMVTDITQRKLAEDENRKDASESADFQQVLFELSKKDKTDFLRSLATILKRDAETMKVERVSYWSMTMDLKSIECRLLYRLSRGAFDPENTGTVLRSESYPVYIQALTQESLIVADSAATDVRTHEFADDYLKSLGISSMLDVPIWLKGRLVGVVCHEHVGPARPWKRSEQAFAQSIGELVSVSLEASERRRAEQEKEALEDQLRQAQKMESIGRLAGGVAHDFNNLLTAISGNTELVLLAMDSQDRRAEKLLQVKKAAASAAELTRKLLAFSRKQIIEPKIIDLNTLIAQMSPILERLIGEDIELRIIPRTRLGRIKVDANQMEQIILNLSINARDAMRSGGKLTIETSNVCFEEEFCRRHADAIPGEYVMLSVSDTGVGMSKAVQEHLFEPFFTTKASGMGTGLGLAMTYGAVKQNKGVIEVFSEPGEGTTFKIYFPRIVDEEVSDTRPSVIGEMPTGTETILFVEDNTMVREFTESVLTGLGYHVLSAPSAEESLAMARHHDGVIQLLMTDVILPGMNGRDLALTLSAEYPKMKVLFNSGYTDDVIAHHGVLDQGIHFISKPFTVQGLARKIREVLDI